MPSIESVTLDVADVAAAREFYADASGVGPQVRLHASDTPARGFRGFTLSLVVAQPSTVDNRLGTARDAGATELRPPKKQLWGGYERAGLAKDARVSPEGTGSHRITIGIDAAPFVDPDGFVWQTAPVAGGNAIGSSPNRG